MKSSRHHLQGRRSQKPREVTRRPSWPLPHRPHPAETAAWTRWSRYAGRWGPTAPAAGPLIATPAEDVPAGISPHLQLQPFLATVPTLPNVPVIRAPGASCGVPAAGGTRTLPPPCASPSPSSAPAGDRVLSPPRCSPVRSNPKHALPVPGRLPPLCTCPSCGGSFQRTL